MNPLSTWSENRPPRTERERAAIADRAAAHLPKPEATVHLSDEDLNAIKAAFIRRFDEVLPRTETMMAVAIVGYRIALRDFAKATGEA